jgi:hypothetical protein
MEQVQKTIQTRAEDFRKSHEKSGYRGGDWFHLSDAEQEVFGIVWRRHWPRMLETWAAYERAIGSFGNDLFPMTDADAAALRKAHGLKEGHQDVKGWVSFAKTFGITQAYAVSIYWKQFAWDCRQGLFNHEKNGDYPFYEVSKEDQEEMDAIPF